MLITSDLSHLCIESLLGAHAFDLLSVSLPRNSCWFECARLTVDSSCLLPVRLGLSHSRGQLCLSPFACHRLAG